MVQADRFTLFEILQMLAVKDAHKEDDLGVDDFIWVNVRETSCRNPRPGSSVKGISRYYGVLSLDGLCVLKRDCSTSIPWPDPCQWDVAWELTILFPWLQSVLQNNTMFYLLVSKAG